MHSKYERLLSFQQYLDDNMYIYPFIVVSNHAYIDYSDTVESRLLFFLSASAYIQKNNIKSTVYICWRSEKGFVTVNGKTGKCRINNKYTHQKFDDKYIDILNSPIKLPTENIKNLIELFLTFRFL